MIYVRSVGDGKHGASKRYLDRRPHRAARANADRGSLRRAYRQGARRAQPPRGARQARPAASGEPRARSAGREIGASRLRPPHAQRTCGRRASRRLARRIQRGDPGRAAADAVAAYPIDLPVAGRRAGRAGVLLLRRRRASGASLLRWPLRLRLSRGEQSMPTHVVWQTWTLAGGRSRRRAVQVEYGRGTAIMSRKRKPNVLRDRKGKSRGEPEAVAAEVLAVRARDLTSDNISAEHAQDALAGFTLGRLLLRGRADPSNPGSITQAQYDAGDEWSQIVRAHARVMGYSLSCPSPSFVMVNSGLSCATDPARSEVIRIRR